ncbi:MAG: polyprenyl synthetase family protein [Bacteroidales bacterium]|nr:polyprenyl synthetase family protein [Bacteroidales bacterium]
MSTAQHSAQELKTLFEEYLFEKAFEGFPDILLEPAMQIMKTKAKRIRPVLLLTACEAFGGSAREALSAASAIEIYHNFTLVHDDIIDEADLRRNVETVHHKFGINKAILTGDAMLIQAYDLLSHSKHHTDILPVFKKTAMEVIEGEQQDVDFEDREEISLKEYMEMIRLKTSVLLAAALQIGAVIGGASEANQKKIYQLGMNLGLAFQIKDDYLDSFGDQKTFGKKIGGDILQNKKTYLLCKAMEKSGEKEKEEIKTTFRETNPDVKINRMIDLYHQLSIPEDTENQMEAHYNQAMKYLQEVSLDPKQMIRLRQLAEDIYQRSF